MLTGDEKYLKHARYALDFLFKYGWDSTNDGWFCFAKKDGSVDYNGYWKPDEYKWGFQQHYALLGILANYEATLDDDVKKWIDKGVHSLNAHMWDERSGLEGYYANANKDWENPRGKGFTPTVDGITTNAELLYLITQNPEHKKRFLQLAHQIVNRLIPEMGNKSVRVLYPENFDSDWNLKLYKFADKKGSIGHFLKTSWCLTRAYLCDTTQKAYLDASKKILDQSWNYDINGVTIWDHVNGGPFNQIDVTTGKYIAKTGKDKDYWTVEQGFTGPMINYYVTQNPIYLQMADESLDFYMQHFVDKTYGETYSTLDPTGTVVKNATKGDDFKAGYHSNELGYYAYLYSHFYYLNQPASLYYKFAPKTTPQDITVTPLSMPEGALRIKSVTLNGAEFETFDSESRTLNIAANEGGKFKVTFEVFASQSAVEEVQKHHITIYPNPTRGNIEIQGLENAKQIVVVDLAGKIVSQHSVQPFDAKQSIDLSKLNTGVYFITIEQKGGEKITKKIIKL